MIDQILADTMMFGKVVFIVAIISGVFG